MRTFTWKGTNPWPDMPTQLNGSKEDVLMMSIKHWTMTLILVSMAGLWVTELLMAFELHEIREEIMQLQGLEIHE